MVGYCVRGIEDERVDSRIGQQVSVAAEHPWIRASIVAKQWLTPIMWLAQAAPHWRLWLQKRVRVRCQDTGHIAGAGRVLVRSRILVMRQKIEHSDESIENRRANV